MNEDDLTKKLDNFEKVYTPIFVLASLFIWMVSCTDDNNANNMSSEEISEEYQIMTHNEVKNAVKNADTVSKARAILNNNGYDLQNSFPVNNDKWTREVYINRNGDTISFTIVQEGFDRYIISVD